MEHVLVTIAWSREDDLHDMICDMCHRVKCHKLYLDTHKPYSMVWGLYVALSWGEPNFDDVLRVINLFNVMSAESQNLSCYEVGCFVTFVTW